MVNGAIIDGINNLGTELKSQIVKELLKDDPVIKKVIRDMVIQEINATKKEEEPDSDDSENP